jgi:hypothetical protein
MLIFYRENKVGMLARPFAMRQNDYKGIRGLCIVKNLFSKHNIERSLVRDANLVWVCWIGAGRAQAAQSGWRLCRGLRKILK